MNAIRIDGEACDGCGACTKACFVNALRWDEAAKRPLAAYAEDCAHCNLCELACKKGCITVTPDFARLRRPAP